MNRLQPFPVGGSDRPSAEPQCFPRVKARPMVLPAAFPARRARSGREDSGASTDSPIVSARGGGQDASLKATRSESTHSMIRIDLFMAPIDAARETVFR